MARSSRHQPGRKEGEGNCWRLFFGSLPFLLLLLLLLSRLLGGGVASVLRAVVEGRRRGTTRRRRRRRRRRTTTTTTTGEWFLRILRRGKEMTRVPTVVPSPRRRNWNDGGKYRVKCASLRLPSTELDCTKPFNNNNNIIIIINIINIVSNNNRIREQKTI